MGSRRNIANVTLLFFSQRRARAAHKGAGHFLQGLNLEISRRLQGANVQSLCVQQAFAQGLHHQ